MNKCIADLLKHLGYIVSIILGAFLAVHISSNSFVIMIIIFGSVVLYETTVDVLNAVFAKNENS